MNLAPHPQPKQDQGIALIVAMLAIAVLMAMAFSFAAAMKIETRLAINADSEQQMLWMGKSGVETARWILSNEAAAGGQPFDSLNQVWAGGPGAGGETNSAIAGFSMQDIPMANGSYSLKIIDLERKVNINTAPPPVLQQALTAMGVDAQSISTVVDSIGDWIDPDDAPRSAGAESDYYQGLTPPYYAKNAPIDDLSELLLIKGITPAMYWGGSVGDHSPAAFQHKLGLGSSPEQEPDYPFGLHDVFTALSSGKININTANANVLQTLPGVDTSTAAEIIKMRAGPDGVDGTEDDTPFVNVGQISAAMPGSQGGGNQLAQLCDVRSRTFEVHVIAKIGNFRREYVAILWRNTPMDIQTLSFRWVSPAEAAAGH